MGSFGFKIASYGDYEGAAEVCPVISKNTYINLVPLPLPSILPHTPLWELGMIYESTVQRRRRRTKLLPVTPPNSIGALTPQLAQFLNVVLIP